MNIAPKNVSVQYEVGKLPVVVRWDPVPGAEWYNVWINGREMEPVMGGCEFVYSKWGTHYFEIEAQRKSGDHRLIPARSPPVFVDIFPTQLVR